VDCYDLAGTYIARASLRTKVGFFSTAEYEQHEKDRTLGLQDIEVIEGPLGPLYDGTWTYDGSQDYSQTLLWAEFYIKATIPDGLQFDAVMWKNFLSSVAKWKAGHTRCVKLSVGWSASDDVIVEDPMALQLKNEWGDGVGCVARYDGTWNYDGAKSYDGDSDSLEVVVV
jgi:hypothetical protein